MSRTGKHRSPSELARDRKRIAELYLQGKYQHEIAEELKMSQATVSSDLRKMQAEWLQSALVNIDEVKAKELAKIDQLERTYWEAWQKSCEDAETTTATMQGDKTSSQLRKEKSMGDPRFLAGVERCIEKRCRIMGIDAPIKVDATTKGESLNPEIMRPSDIAKQVAMLLANEQPGKDC